jgi:WD40 repeat protein
MRLLTFLLTFLLILTACAAPAAPQITPSALLEMDVTARPTVYPTEATFETSLLVTEWKGHSEGILLYPLDPANGNALPGYEPIPLGGTYFHAFSPDRRTLAIVSFPNDSPSYSANGSLILIDLAAWKTRQFETELNGWVTAMVFSPDGTRLALTYGDYNNNLAIFDLQQGIITAREQTDSFVTRLKFTASGEALMLYTMSSQTAEDGMSASPRQVLLLDAADLSPRWTAELVGVRDGVYPTDEETTPANFYEPGRALYFSPGIAFAPDRDALHIVHANSDQLTTVDFETQQVKTLDIHTELSWFERLLSLTAGVAHAKIGDGTSKQIAVSPDGQFLYVVGVHNESFQDSLGNIQMSQTPLGLEIIRTSDGSRTAEIETRAGELSLSPDGLFLYLRYWADHYTVPWTEVFDTSSSQVIARKAGLYASPAFRINGEHLLVSTYSLTENSHQMSISQPEDLSVLTEWSGASYIAWLMPQ